MKARPKLQIPALIAKYAKELKVMWMLEFWLKNKLRTMIGNHK